MADSLQLNEPQHARPPCPLPTFVFTQTHVHWVDDAIQPSHHLLSPSPPALNHQASGSFQMSQLFTSGGWNIGVSASTSVLPMNTQDWFPLGWTGWISLQSKGLSRLSNTIVQKHQFFGTQLSLLFNSHVHRWLLEKPSVQFSHSVLSDSLRPHGLRHASLPVHHQLPEFTQTHVRWVGDAIQPSHHLSLPSPPALNLS